jgi:hypothetical protein
VTCVTQEAPPHTFEVGGDGELETAGERRGANSGTQKRWHKTLAVKSAEGHRRRTESADTHTYECVFIIRKMATTYDHRSVTRERAQNVRSVLLAGGAFAAGRQSATETLEGSAAALARIAKAPGPPPPK